MEKQNFPNSGALFYRRNKKNANGPDIGGDIDLGADILQYVLQMHRAGNPVKLELAGWRKADRNGQNFYSLRVRKPYDAAEMTQRDPQTQSNGYAAAKAEKNPWEA